MSSLSTFLDLDPQEVAYLLTQAEQLAALSLQVRGNQGEAEQAFQEEA